MDHPILRLNDGFEHTSPALRDEVAVLQAALKNEGLPVEVDGLFGRETESAVKRFQVEHGLADDGIVGALTWAALLQTPTPDPQAVFETTFAPANASLVKQLEAAMPYKGAIDEGASRYELQPALIGGIGSRESQWGLALSPVGPAGTGDFAKRGFPTQFRSGPLPPDGGFGRGLMQIDFDAHPFARTGNWKDPRENILYGCSVLNDCRSFLQRKTNLQGRALLQAAVAAYNCGPGNVLTAIRDGRSVDFYTAGRDYSADTLNRAGFFQMHGWA